MHTFFLRTRRKAGDCARHFLAEHVTCPPDRILNSVPAPMDDLILFTLSTQGLRLRRGNMLTGRYNSGDRKSTRLNSSHLVISYAVFCLKKKKTTTPSSSL